MTRNILFTFDYELFLGQRSGTPENCIIKPTQLILSLLKQYNIKHAIFFVDTTYLIKLLDAKEPVYKKHYQTITEQLKEIIGNGHYVYPHIHPHWIDALPVPNKGEWSLKNYSKYRFHNITKEEQSNLFDRSINLLHSIIDPVFPNYEICGYRAGGWCIQPFSDFSLHFKKHNVKYDFSVLKYYSNSSPASYYDFSNTPVNEIYRFEDDVIKEVKNGMFTEFSISTLRFSAINNLLNRLFLKYLWKTNNRSIGDGIGISIEESQNPQRKKGREMIAIELLNKIRFNPYILFLEKNNYMHFISHPKMLSKHNLKTFDKFLSYTTKRYVLETDYKKMIPIY